LRVTHNMNFNSIHEAISRSRNRMAKSQEQASTQKKLNTPSDDPVGSARILEMRTDKVNNQQFITNSKMAQAFLSNSDGVLQELVDIVVRAKEIAVNQSSDASSSESARVGVAEEVSQLFQQAVANGNRRIADRYLFGGYRTDQAPVSVDGRYQGDDGQMMVEVSKDVFVAMNLDGMSVFNTDPESSMDFRNLRASQKVDAEERGIEFRGSEPNAVVEGMGNVNVFQELKNLRIGLLTGDTGGIRATLERFDALHERLVSMRAKIGSRLQGLGATETTLERHDITNATLSSSIEDADMGKVMTDIAREETVLRSSLQTSKKLVQPTLMDFIN